MIKTGRTKDEIQTRTDFVKSKLRFERGNEPNALLDFCTSFNLSQMVDKPTRITQSSRSLINVILASSNTFIKRTKVVANSISDHDMVVAVLNLKKSRTKPVYISTRCFKNYDRESS
jgi:hypothetical protein